MRKILIAACALIGAHLLPAVAIGSEGFQKAEIPATPMPTSELPATPNDPILAELMVEAQALLEKSRHPGYLDPIDTSKPWPCPVTELQLRKFAGILTSKEMLTESGNTEIKEMSGITAVRDVRTSPIVAQCKNGKLDGALEFVIDYTSVIEAGTVIIESNLRQLIKVSVSAGELVEAALKYSSGIGFPSKTTYSDPAMQAQMAQYASHQPKEFHLIAVVDRPGKSTIKNSSYIVSMVERFQSPAAARKWSTTLIWPTSPSPQKSHIYEGQKLATAFSLKFGALDGAFLSFPRVIDGGYNIPGGIMCYRNGEKLDTLNCQEEQIATNAPANDPASAAVADARAKIIQEQIEAAARAREEQARQAAATSAASNGDTAVAALIGGFFGAVAMGDKNAPTQLLQQMVQGGVSTSSDPTQAFTNQLMTSIIAGSLGADPGIGSAGNSPEDLIKKMVAAATAGNTDALNRTIAQMGNTAPASRTSSVSSGSGSVSGTGGDLTAQRKAIAIQCQKEAEAMPKDGTPQVDNLCMLAAFDLCIANRAQIDNYNQEAKQTCQSLTAYPAKRCASTCDAVARLK